METQDLIALALVYSIIAVSLLTATLLEKKGAECNIRKVVHIGVGCFVFVWWMFTESWIMLAFFTIPFAIILFLAMFGERFMPIRELNDLTVNKGHKTGLFLYAVTVSIMVIFFEDHWTAATIGVVAMTFGDGFGSVIGKRYGKHRIINGKSVEGSLGVFAATAIAAATIMIYYGWLTAMGYYPGGDSVATIPLWAASVIAGLVSMILEAICPGQIDNIVTPVLVAISMCLIGL